MKEEPYTHKDADAAIGLWTEKGQSEKMIVDEDMEKSNPGMIKVAQEEEDDAEVHDAFFKAY